MADFAFCSEGCYEDCHKLLVNFEKNYEESKSLTFETFAEEWRKMHFELIFSGRQENCEQINFTRQLIDIAKSFIFIPGGKTPICTGALYLCYGLFYKQECNAQVLIPPTPLSVPQVKSAFTKIQELKHQEKIINCFVSLRVLHRKVCL